MNYRKFTTAEIKEKNKVHQRAYYAKYKHIILPYQKGRINREQFQKLMAEAKKVEKNKKHNCIDCGKEITTKGERCIRCNNIYEGKKHIRLNPIKPSDYKYSKLFNDYHCGRLSS